MVSELTDQLQSLRAKFNEYVNELTRANESIIVYISAASNLYFNEPRKN